VYGNERSTKKVYCLEFRCKIGAGGNNLKAVDIGFVHVYQCDYSDKVVQAVSQ
jgi:hypothetical protein